MADSLARAFGYGRIHTLVGGYFAESALDPDCPLVEMARQQGGGVVRRTERGVFENVYVKRDGSWKIQQSAYRLA